VELTTDRENGRLRAQPEAEVEVDEGKKKRKPNELAGNSDQSSPLIN
jgi:hypothetical protein